jgi:hypothetical protein
MLLPRTSLTPSRSRKRRRSNTPGVDQAIGALNALAQPTAADESLVRPTEATAKRLDAGDPLRSIASLTERLAELEERFIRREHFMNGQFQQVFGVLQEQLAMHQQLIENCEDNE